MHDKPISGALSKIIILVLEHKLSVRGQEGLAVFNFVLCLNKIQLLTISPVTWFIRFNQVVRIYAETSHFYEKSITYKPAFIFLTLWYFGFLLVKWVSVSCGVSPPPWETLSWQFLSIDLLDLLGPLLAVILSKQPETPAGSGPSVPV